MSFLVSLMLSHDCSIFLISHLLTYSLFSLSYHSPFYPKGDFQGLSSPSSGKERNKPREPSSHPWPLVPSSLLTCIFSGYFPIQPVGPEWTKLCNSSGCPLLPEFLLSLFLCHLEYHVFQKAPLATIVCTTGRPLVLAPWDYGARTAVDSLLVWLSNLSLFFEYSDDTLLISISQGLNSVVSNIREMTIKCLLKLI